MINQPIRIGIWPPNIRAVKSKFKTFFFFPSSPFSMPIILSLHHFKKQPRRMENIGMKIVCVILVHCATRACTVCSVMLWCVLCYDHDSWIIHEPKSAVRSIKDQFHCRKCISCNWLPPSYCKLMRLGYWIRSCASERRPRVGRWCHCALWSTARASDPSYFVF